MNTPKYDKFDHVRKKYTLEVPTILSQSSNPTRKGPEIHTTNCCRAVYVGKIAQLILKNLYRREYVVWSMVL